MIKINTLEDAKEFILDKKCTIEFQAFTFYSMNSFEEFINEIENGKKFIFKKGAHFYTNFADEIYADTCIVGKENIYFFKDSILIIKQHRCKKDDIQWGFWENDKCHTSGSILNYNYEQDEEYEEWYNNEDQIY